MKNQNSLPLSLENKTRSKNEKDLTVLPNKDLYMEIDSPFKNENDLILETKKEICLEKGKSKNEKDIIVEPLKEESKIPSKLKKNDTKLSDFYCEIFKHAAEKEYKSFFSDFNEIESIEQIEDLHKLILFENPQNYFVDSNINIEFFKNIIHNYFEENTNFPYTLKPFTSLTDEDHTPLYDPLIISEDSTKIIAASMDFAIRIWTINLQDKSFKMTGIFWGHNEKITLLSVNKSWTYLFSVSSNTIYMWNIPSQSKLAIFKGHTSNINGICLLEDENNLISNSLDSIRWWDFIVQKQLTVLEHKGVVIDMVLSENKLFILYQDRMDVYDAKAMTIIKDLSIFQSFLSISINSKFNLLVTTSKKDENKHYLLTVWNLDSLIQLKNIDFEVEYSHPQKIYLTESKKVIFMFNRFIQIWDISDIENPIKKEIKKLERQNGYICDLKPNIAISFDSKKIYVIHEREIRNEDTANEQDYITLEIDLDSLHMDYLHEVHNQDWYYYRKGNLTFTSDSTKIIWQDNEKNNIWNLLTNQMEFEPISKKLEYVPIDNKKINFEDAIFSFTYGNIVVQKGDIKKYISVNQKLVDFSKQIFAYINQKDFKILNYLQQFLLSLSFYSNPGYFDIYKIIISPDESKIATHQGYTIHLWNISREKCLLFGQSHTSSISNLIIISKNGKKQIVSLDSAYEEMKIWDFNSASLSDSRDIKKIEYTSDYIITNDLSKLILFNWGRTSIFDFSTSTKEQLNFKLDKSICCPFFSDPKKILFAQTNSIIIWDLDTNLQVSTHILSCPVIIRISLSPDSNFLVVIDDKEKILVFNLKSLEEKKLEKKNDERIILIRFTIDSMKIIILREKNNVEIWGTKQGDYVANIVLANDVLDLLVTHDNNIIYSSMDNSITVINLNDSNQCKTYFINDIYSPITAMAQDMDSKNILFGNQNGLITLRDINNFEIKKDLIDKNIDFYEVGKLQITSDKKKLLNLKNETLHIWDLEKNKEVKILNKINQSLISKMIYVLTEEPQPKLIYVNSRNEIAIFDFETLKTIEEFKISVEGEESKISKLALDKDNLISAWNDGSIRIWDMNGKKQIMELPFKIEYGSVEFFKIIPSQNALVIVTYLDWSTFGFDVWDLGKSFLYKNITRGEKGRPNNSFKQIVFAEKLQKIFTITKPTEENAPPLVVDATVVNIYSIDKNFKLESTFKIPKNYGKISKLQDIPNIKMNKIILLLSTEKYDKFFIWDFKLQMCCCILNLSPTFNDFIFPNNSSHIAINQFHDVVDLQNDQVLIQQKIRTNSEIILDENNNLICGINGQIIKKNIVELLNISSNFYQLKIELLINEGEANLEEIIKKNLLIFPFRFNFLHMLAIIGSFENLNIKKLKNENWDTFSNMKLPINPFISLDFREKTCLDIAMDQKNKKVLNYYFNMIFKAIENNSESIDENCRLYQKLKFFSYDFNYASQNMSSLLHNLINLYGEDTEILNKIFDLSLVTLDLDFYCSNLIELELVKPIYITTSAFDWLKDEKIVKLELSKRLKGNVVFGKDSTQVNCKVLLLKGLTNAEDSNYNFWEGLLQLDSSNKIFANKTLQMLIEYKWNSYAKYTFFRSYFIFLFFFLLYLINFIYLFPDRVSNDQENVGFIVVSIIIDIVDLIYFLSYAYGEFKQIKKIKFMYFSEFWNYVDVLVIIFTIISIILDFAYMSTTNDLAALQTFVALALLSLWLRLLSYSRGFEGTGFLVRLVQQTIIDMRYFLLMIFLFALAFASAGFMFQKDFSQSQFYVFNLIYRLVLGDYTYYDEYVRNLNQPI